MHRETAETACLSWDIALPVLELRDLRVSFPTPAGPARAVRGVDLSLDEGEALGVVGESGCGKSVSMLAALGLLPATAQVTGSVRYRGRELLGAPGRELRQIRGAHVAMVFQDPVTALNPVIRVGRQIAEGLRVHHREVSRRQAWDRAAALLGEVGIAEPDRRARQYPHELSGGMCQRAMIAMAMANEPDVLIADEPTTALDVTIQAQILDLLAALRRDRGMAVVLISHDLGVVASMAERVAVMYAGRVVELGAAGDVLGRPRHPYTRGLLRARPRVSASSRDRLVAIEGRLPSLVSPLAGCAFHPRCELADERCRVEEPELLPVGADAVAGPGDHVTGLAACHHPSPASGRDPHPPASGRDPHSPSAGR